MKKIFSIVLTAAAILTACDRFEGENSEVRTSFIGTIVPATRTTLVENGEGYTINWVAGDRISVSNGSAVALYEASAGGSTTTEFKPVGNPLSGSSFTAVYPETLFEGILPATQTYAGNDIIGMPMAGSCGDDPAQLIFSPASGIVRIQVATGQSGVSLSAVKLSADQPMSGSAVLSNGILGVTEGSGVTLDCGEGVAIGAQAKPFLIHIPAGSYTGLQITLVATDGKEAVVTLSDATAFKVLRGQVNTVNVNSAVFAAPTSARKAVLRSGSDVNELMKQLSDASAKSSSGNTTIKKIVFKVNQSGKGTTLVSEAGAEPVWITLDQGILTFTTRADEIYANRNMGFMFSRLHALTEIEGLEHLNTSETEYMSALFRADAVANPALTTVDLSSFDTRNVVSMTSMFDSLVNLKSVNLSNFNTARCKSFASMFNHCKALESIDLSHFETSQCESMYRMFRYCESLTELDLHNWDLSKVNNMNRCFQYCVNLKKLDLGGDKCNTESVTDATHFVNASNRITEMRLGKNFLLQNYASMPELFYQGIGFLLATVDDPLVITCPLAFVQKSLRTSTQALKHTNDRLMVWKNIENGEYAQFDQPVGSMTNTVKVIGDEDAPKTYIDVKSASEFETAVAQVKTFDEKAEPVIRLQADFSYDKEVNMGNENGIPVTLDLNGHILSTSVKNFITANLGELTVTDSGATKGKITNSESFVFYAGGSGILNLRDCRIESTKPLGESWNQDAMMTCVGNATINIIDSWVYATGKLSLIRMNNSSAYVNVSGDSELASGTQGEEGFYCIVNIAGHFTMNSGSLYTKSITSGTAPSALHHGGSGAYSTVNGGYLYSAGARTVSAGGVYMPNITLNGCYLDKEPSQRPTGENVTYGAGKSIKSITPVEKVNPITGATLSYKYKVE